MYICAHMNIRPLKHLCEYSRVSGIPLRVSGLAQTLERPVPSFIMNETSILSISKTKTENLRRDYALASRHLASHDERRYICCLLAAQRSVCDISMNTPGTICAKYVNRVWRVVDVFHFAGTPAACIPASSRLSSARDKITL